MKFFIKELTYIQIHGRLVINLNYLQILVQEKQK